MTPFVVRQAQEAALKASLQSALTDLPLHKGALDLLAGASQVGGAFAKVEASYRLWDSAALVAGAGWEKDSGFGVSAGLRWEWE